MNKTTDFAELSARCQDIRLVFLIWQAIAHHLDTMKQAQMRMLFTAAYAGLRREHLGVTLQELGDELGVSANTMARRLDKWQELLETGDVAATELYSAFRKQFVPTPPATQQNAASKPENAPEPKQNALPPDIVPWKRPQPTVPEHCLGFVYNGEQQQQYRDAIRAATHFFTSFGGGSRPRRSHGQHTTSRKLLSQNRAECYCGCTSDELEQAAGQGELHRICSKGGYLYNIDELYAFVVNHNL